MHHSYSKGASVLRMLIESLGEAKFLNGIRKYIAKHKWGCATNLDLWAALSEASGQNVTEFMKAWVHDIGYPLLRVTRDGNRIHVAQERCLASGDVRPEEDQTIWKCPLGIYTGDNKAASAQGMVLLSEKKGTFDLSSAAVDFFKLNRGQTAFYRTLYAANDLEKIGKAISGSNAIDTPDRVGLIGDTFALATAGYSSTVDALRLLKHFSNEKEYIVLNSIAEKLNFMKSVWAMEAEGIRDSLCALARSIFSATAKRVGWEFPAGEGHLAALLRQLAISQAGMNGDQEIVAEARRRFNKYVQGDTEAIHPDLRGAVYSIVLKHAPENQRTEFDAIKKIYENDQLAADQRLAALSSLGSIQTESILREVLDYGLNSDKVRPQDLMYPLRSVANNRKGRVLAWKFVQDNWSTLEERYRSSMSLLSHCVGIADDWADEEFANEQVEAFFKGKDTAAIDRRLAQTLEQIRSHAKWVNRDRDGVRSWLESNFHQ
jgi:aminopeptidase 2